MLMIQFVKKVWGEPDMSDSIAESRLWSFTGYPAFFRTDNPAREMAYSLRHCKRSLKRGFSVDEIYCGNDKIK